MSKKKELISILNPKIINKKYYNYNIQLNSQIDLLNISIQQNNSFKIYQSSFNLEFINSFKLFSSKNVQQIIELICDLIDQNNIEIDSNDKNLKLHLISIKYPIVELMLKKINYNSNEVIEKIINELENIKNENKLLKNYFQKIKKILGNEELNIDEINLNIKNEKDEDIKKENEKLINKELNKINLNIKNEKDEDIKKEDEKLKNEKVKKINKNINMENINEIKDNIKKNDEINKNILEKFKNNNKLTQYNLKNINSIKIHKIINSISILPSGNIISVTSNGTIIIYDINFNILQQIKNAHDKGIGYVEVKDENNFITCSSDKSIKLWIKKENNFIINQIIKDAHEDTIKKVIYDQNENLISCSWDNTIKIWKINNNIYECIITLFHFKHINSILFLEDKKLLISSGNDGTKLWDLNKDDYIDINCIKHFENTSSGSNKALCRLNDDNIIIGGNIDGIMKIISISKKEIIKEINNTFLCWEICLIEDKGIFLTRGKSKDIKVYMNDNYECIQTIIDAHNEEIKGLIELKDGLIASFSKDKTIKIWEL